MIVCIICGFETELDDVKLGNHRDRCICIRCFARETGSVRRMSAALERDVMQALAALETG